MSGKGGRKVANTAAETSLKTLTEILNASNAADPHLRAAIYVEWVDASGASGWQHIDHLNKELLHVHSVGWLIDITDDALLMCKGWPDYESLLDLEKIPLNWVVNVKELMTWPTN